MKPTNFYINQFLDYLHLRKNYSTHTISNYERDLCYLDNFLIENSLPLHKITRQHCRHFLEIHFHNKNSKTISRYISSFRSFFNFLNKHHNLSNNPWKQIRLPKQTQSLPHTLSTKDILSFLDNIDTSSLIGLRNRAICECLYGLGLRVSELCQLNLDDCNFESKECRILGKGNVYRTVYIGKITEKIILNYIETYRKIYMKPTSVTLLINKFGTPLSTRSIQRIVKKCAETQGLSHSLTPHTLRHCFASDLYRGGADLAIIKDLLGHKNLSTTEIYTHVANEDLAQSLNESHPHA